MVDRNTLTSRLHRGLVALAALVTASVAAWSGGRGESPDDGSDWPRWRGPEANGISTEAGWDTGKVAKLRFAWQAAVGRGFSGVSVADNRLYTMGNDLTSDHVVCLDARNGKELWSHSYPCDVGEWPGPRVTPTVDGERVYTLSQFGDLYCLQTATGSVVWQENLIRDLGAGKPGWGFAGSPVVRGDLLLLNAGRSGMALDKMTGKLVWGTPGIGGYASVVEFAVDGVPLLAVFGERALYGVDPSSGAVAWSYPWVTANDVNAADPLPLPEGLFISSDYGQGCALLRVTADGAEPLWRNRRVSSHFSSFVYLEGAIFANDGDANAHRGGFYCLDPSTGGARWQQYLGVGSLLAAGGRLFLLNERGNLRVAEASASRYVELASADFPAGLYWTAPVLSHGRLYVRNMNGDLFCVDLRS